MNNNVVTMPHVNAEEEMRRLAAAHVVINKAFCAAYSSGFKAVADALWTALAENTKQQEELLAANPLLINMFFK